MERRGSAFGDNETRACALGIIRGHQAVGRIVIGSATACERRHNDAIVKRGGT